MTPFMGVAARKEYREICRGVQLCGGELLATGAKELKPQGSYGCTATGSTAARVGIAATIALAISVSGCSKSDPRFARVSGRVTLDGKPLAGVVVEFQPEKGSPSYGVTDQQGRYWLRFSHEQGGALIGPHIVRIWARNPGPQSAGGSYASSAAGSSGSPLIPPKFNRQSKLEVTVNPGSNYFEFELSSH